MIRTILYLCMISAFLLGCNNSKTEGTFEVGKNTFY